MVYLIPMPKSTRTIAALLLALVLTAGCASSPSTATVIRTLHNPDPPRFNNVLIIGVAGDYASRAMFEADLARALSSDDINASPYYTVVGRRPQLARATIHDAIRVRGFDAVIFTRLKGQEQRELAPTRPVGPGFDLFGYDYTELNRDIGIREAQAITFITEVYDTATQRKIWAIETLSVDRPTATALIEEQVNTIARQLQQDGLI